MWIPLFRSRLLCLKGKTPVSDYQTLTSLRRGLNKLAEGATTLTRKLGRVWRPSGRSFGGTRQLEQGGGRLTMPPTP